MRKLNGRFLNQLISPSYVVDIPDHGSVLRNCKFIKPCIENSAGHFVQISTEQNGNADNNKEEASSYFVTRSGRVSKPPKRLSYDRF